MFSFIKKLFPFYKENKAEQNGQDIEEKMMETLKKASSEGDIDLEEDEQEMIHSIFELGDTMVREIMIPRVKINYIEEDDTFEKIRIFVEKTGHSRFPLVKDGIDNVIGIIFVKDLFLKEELISSGKMTLRQLARKPLIVPESKKLDELLRDMKLSKNQFALVIDEYGGTAGIVTMEDILEEIVGEIEDEYDMEFPPIREVKQGQYLVDGDVSLEDLNEEIKAGLPDDEFETVAGFIYDQVGSLPNEGQAITIGKLKFVVEKLLGQRIDTVRVILQEKPRQEGKNADATNNR